MTKPAPPSGPPSVAEEPMPRLADMELTVSSPEGRPEGRPAGGGGPGKGGRPGSVSSGASRGVLLEGVVSGTAYCESATEPIRYGPLVRLGNTTHAIGGREEEIAALREAGSLMT